MSGYSINIEQKTLENDYFREVLYTAKHMQLVVMTLQVGEEIGQDGGERGLVPLGGASHHLARHGVPRLIVAEQVAAQLL